MEITASTKGIISVRVVTKKDQAVSVNPLLSQAVSELQEYFAGSRMEFDVPLDFSASPFHLKCRQMMQKIPYGQTITYKELAISAGSPLAVRAAGQACAKNPIAIPIPCHRILRSGEGSEDSRLGGYAYGLEVKQALLHLERTNTTSLKIAA